jgi:hypothetical protein
MVLYPALSLVSINPEDAYDRSARDAFALAQGRGGRGRWSAGAHLCILERRDRQEPRQYPGSVQPSIQFIELAIPSATSKSARRGESQGTASGLPSSCKNSLRSQVSEKSSRRPSSRVSSRADRTSQRREIYAHRRFGKSARGIGLRSEQICACDRVSRGSARRQRSATSSKPIDQVGPGTCFDFVPRPPLNSVEQRRCSSRVKAGRSES